MRYAATAPLLTLLLLAACGAPTQGTPEASTGSGAGGKPGPREALSETVARLPPDAAGFTRGPVKDYETTRPGYGQGVEYTTPRREALGTVDIYDRGMATVPSETTLIRTELDEAVRELSALQHSRTGRSLEETERTTLNVPNSAAPMQCAGLNGRYGRVPVALDICVGMAAGRFIKVQVTMPQRTPELADAPAFALAVATAAQRR